MFKKPESFICCSVDIAVGEEQKILMIKKLEERFLKQEFECLQVKKTPLKSYLSKSRTWSSVIVFFAGYGMERYGPNLWKHLIFFPRKMFGINIDGHIFEIRRFSVMKLLLVRILWNWLSKLSGKIYEVALSWYATPSSSNSRPEH